MFRKLKAYLSNSKLYKSIRDGIPDPIVDKDSVFMDIYHDCRPFTMTSKLKMYALYQSVIYVIVNDIPGDFIECGVWRGGNAILIQKVLDHMGVNNRKIFLFDTFEGMTQPTAVDVKQSDHRINAHSKWKKMQNHDQSNNWYLASMSEVKENIISCKINLDNFVFVKGRVEDTIPGYAPKSISLIRLDTDWYESTKHELVHLYPILSARGIVIIDDYGSWVGSKKATDEYFMGKELLNRIDRTGRLIIKSQY